MALSWLKLCTSPGIDRGPVLRQIQERPGSSAFGCQRRCRGSCGSLKLCCWGLQFTVSPHEPLDRSIWQTWQITEASNGDMGTSSEDVRKKYEKSGGFNGWSSSSSSSSSDWWLEHYLFPYIGNNHSNWLSYFSEGSKPPTSHHNHHHHRHPPYPDFHPPTPPYQYPHPQIWSCSASTGHLGDDFPPANCYRIPTVPGGKVVPPQWHDGWFMFVGLCYPHVHSLEFF